MNCRLRCYLNLFAAFRGIRYKCNYTAEEKNRSLNDPSTKQSIETDCFRRFSCTHKGLFKQSLFSWNYMPYRSHTISVHLLHFSSIQLMFCSSKNCARAALDRSEMQEGKRRKKPARREKYTKVVLGHKRAYADIIRLMSLIHHLIYGCLEIGQQ
jgi:hypothetical protein